MQFDTLIIGAGAAGLMCATQAQGRILVIDHAKAPGEKIRNQAVVAATSPI